MKCLTLSYSCRSFIGRVPEYYQPQGVTLGAGCVNSGTVIHEIGHVCGFYHEHTRHDRDEHIRVLTENIRSQSLHREFNKLREGDANTLGYGYDYASVMHYSSDTFAVSGRDTIVSRQPNIPVGGDELSPLDIAKTNALYKCGEYHFQEVLEDLVS